MNGNSKPKVEVVRIPSTERAKILNLVDGGVQIQATFQHHITANYASCSTLEDNKHYLRFQRHPPPHRKPHFHRNAASLATKSCDNIFARNQVYSDVVNNGPDSPFTWRDATRSEEQLYQSSCSQSPVSQVFPHNTRSRILALLKKLSPLPRRSKGQEQQNPFPFFVVEFSHGGNDSQNEPSKRTVRCDSNSSKISDKSFIIAVKESELRKEELRKEQTATKTRRYFKKNEIRPTVTTQVYVSSSVPNSVSPVSPATPVSGERPTSIQKVQNIRVKNTTRCSSAGG